MTRVDALSPLTMEDSENRQYARFERGDEFLGYLSTFLSCDLSQPPPDEAQDDAEQALLDKLTIIVSQVSSTSLRIAIVS